MSTNDVTRDSSSAGTGAAQPGGKDSDLHQRSPREADAPDKEMPDKEMPTRGAIVRDVIFFQVKLWLDGFKDVVLSPLSIAAAALDFVFHSKRRSLFYGVLRLGERFDLWLNLYSAAERGQSKRGGMLDPDSGDDRPSLDDLLRQHADPDPRRSSSRSSDGGRLPSGPS